MRSLDQIRERRIGDLLIVPEPPDVELYLDGRRVDPTAGPVAALAGFRRLEARRAGYGYGALLQPVEILAGQQTSMDLILERTSAVIRLHSRPVGATVLLDGQAQTVTAGTAPPEFLPQGSAYRPNEFSAETVLVGVEPGLRVLEVAKEGFRTYRAELRIDEFIDYPMPPIVLEGESGTLVFRDLPRDAKLLIDGQPARLTDGEISLPPGEHQVQVTSGAARMFSRRLLLADRQRMDVPVRLKPGLAFLGVIGGNSGDATRLTESLRRTLSTNARWSFIDRTQEGPGLLTQHGVARLAEDVGADWSGWQSTADAQAPGMLYVAALLSDDLLANTATLLIWSRAPGPARPNRVQIPLDQPGAVGEVASLLDQTLPTRRPWSGVFLIDTDLEPHPVVADVTPGSPAESAGIRVGDRILGVSGVPVTSRAAFDNRLATAEVGKTLELAVQSPGGSRTTPLRLGNSPLLLDPASPDVLDAVLYTDLELKAETAPREERWILRLNQALILLRSGNWQEAVRRLRDLDVPQRSHGLAQGTVDYYLGLALAQGGGQYTSQARAMFERASKLLGARLRHHDHAWVAPPRPCPPAIARHPRTLTRRPVSSPCQLFREFRDSL